MAGDLIAAGHPDPLRYTPRQAWAWWRLGQRRRYQDLAGLAGAVRMAGADHKSFQRYIKTFGG